MELLRIFFWEESLVNEPDGRVLRQVFAQLRVALLQETLLRRRPAVHRSLKLRHNLRRQHSQIRLPCQRADTVKRSLPQHHRPRYISGAH